jgi:hypothetical protein
VQRALREAFARWGLPEQVRVDNGRPWAGWSDLPPPLALWLVGLGVDLVVNPPGRPEHNGVVERSHRTAQAWAGPGSCASYEELQRRLDEADERQRQEYPYAGSTRWQLYPGLRQARREYRPEREAEGWCLARVQRELEARVVVRQADCWGKISLYNRNVAVGRAARGRPVWVQLDPVENRWVIRDEQGRFLHGVAATEIDAERIRRLDVCGPK